MKLMWFEEVGDSHVFLFDTNADLPRVGEYVFIRDFDNHCQTDSYRITDVTHSINKSTLSEDLIADRRPKLRSVNLEDRYQEMVDLLEKEMDGVIHPGPTPRTFGLIRQHAEVLIKKEKLQNEKEV